MVFARPSRPALPEDGVSPHAYNAPASLEMSERKIKISKGFCIVEVAENLTGS
jgi:hypothetical protein